MKIENGILYAGEGMILTNGTEWGSVVIPAVGADISLWKEITKAEAETLEQVPPDLALAELQEVLV